MNEFLKARLKLTGWYLFIIMLVSSFFSLGIYQILTREMERGLRTQALRFIPRERFGFDETILAEVKQRIALNLILVNGGILLFSGFASYFLADKTLKPIEKAMEEQKRFVGDASHELKTPLTSLKTEIEVALRDKKLDLKDAKQLLISNLEEVDKMQSLADYLLLLSRYEDGSKKLDFKEVNLAEVARKAIEGLKCPAKERGIAIEVKLKDAAIRGNALSLIQLASILIDNAVKYNRRGGTVIVKTAKIGSRAILSVKDTGVGIKALDIPYIFNRFYRADSSRSKVNVDGYGLGLSIAKSIAHLHGGKIEVESEPAKGSTFSVTI